MTLEEIKAIVTAPGQYCLTYRRKGACVSRLATIWAVWAPGEYEQVRGGQDVAIVVTSEMSLLLTHILTVTPYRMHNPDAATDQAVD